MSNRTALFVMTFYLGVKIGYSRPVERVYLTVPILVVLLVIICRDIARKKGTPLHKEMFGQVYDLFAAPFRVGAMVARGIHKKIRQ